MQSVLQVFRSQGAAPKGQNPCFVFNMKGKKLPPADLKTLVEDALHSASEFAKLNLGRAKA
jgi:hypothetical protein